MIDDGVLIAFQRRLQAEETAPEASQASQNASPSDVTLRTDHFAALRETEDFERSVKCVRSHNQNITKIIDWIKTSYPDAYESMTRPLTTDEMADQKLYYKGTRDFIYSNVNSGVIKAFIASHKVKETTDEGRDMHYGYDTLRKYHDAVLLERTKRR